MSWEVILTSLKTMYEGVVCGKTSEFPVITGLHKGSALSPYFFALYGRVKCSYSWEGTLVNVVWRWYNGGG